MRAAAAVGCYRIFCFPNYKTNTHYFLPYYFVDVAHKSYLKRILSLLPVPEWMSAYGLLIVIIWHDWHCLVRKSWNCSYGEECKAPASTIAGPWPLNPLAFFYSFPPYQELIFRTLAKGCWSIQYLLLALIPPIYPMLFFFSFHFIIIKRWNRKFPRMYWNFWCF